MSTKLTEDDATLRTKFSELKTFTDVSLLLDVTPAKLRYYLRRTDNYKVFTLRKKSGGLRTISTPVTALKIIQSKLNQVLHAVYRGRSPVHGFVRHKSIVTNASMHLDRRMLLNFDLEDFFPSIHFGRVKGLFEGKPYSLPEPVAVTLAQICCRDGILPAGAPTSPLVSNMLCAQMDSQLKTLAVDCGCRYTRYADDITFSVSRGRFPPLIAYRDPGARRWVIGVELSNIISANGFKIKESKTRVLPQGYKQEVTGLIVGHRVNVKRKFVRQVRAMLHAAETWGVEAAAREFYARFDRKQRTTRPNFLRVLRGKIEFVGSVRGRDDDIYLRMLDRYLTLDPTASARPVIATPRATFEALTRAIWLLEEQGGPKQGTGFAAEKLDLITADHVLTEKTQASCPALSLSNKSVNVIRREDHVDVARVSLQTRLPVQLKFGNSAALKIGDRVRVLGFPLHRDGASVSVTEGKIISVSSMWHGVPHCIVDCSILRGNSGGPILNDQNEVVGIAVKGQGTPKKFCDDDEQSRFVPVDFAVPYLITLSAGT